MRGNVYKVTKIITTEVLKRYKKFSKNLYGKPKPIFETFPHNLNCYIMAMSSSGVTGSSSYYLSSSLSMPPSPPNSVTFEQQQQHRSSIPSKGYPLQILGRDPNEIDPNFLCSSCGKILREPVQASCGHRFCLNCLTQLLEGHPGPVLCSLCIGEGVAYATIDAKKYPDKAIKRVLDKQNVVCAHPDCLWKGKLAEYPSHEEACPIASASKAGASETDLVPQARRLPSKMEHDFEMVGMDETGSGLICNVGRKNENLQRRAVAGTAVPATTPGVDKAARIAAETEKILKPLLTPESKRFVRSVSVPSSTSGDSLSRPQLQQQPLGFTSTPSKTPGTSTTPTQADLNSTVTKKLEDMAAVVNISLDRLLNQVMEIDNQRRREGETRKDQEKRIRLLEEALALKDAALADQSMRLEMMESISYDGIFVWKISDFNKKKMEAISGLQRGIYSPYFFTSRFGYKICARIHLNGNGKGKGRYVSLFLVIMRSQNDPFLSWPFKQKVTLTLLDQGPSGEHVVDAFRPDTTSLSFSRPESEMNVGEGCPLFAPLQFLEPPNTYVVDDTAYIKIVVDTRGLQ